MVDVIDWIGKTSKSSDKVSKSQIDSFRATISSLVSPEVVPPGFHWCLFRPDENLSDLAEDGHPAKGGFLPPIDLPRRMWAASEIEFLKPLGVGQALQRTSKILDIRKKNGRSGKLSFLEVSHEISQDRNLKIRERQTIVYREFSSASLPLPDEGEPNLKEWPIVRPMTPSTALLFRYSALTFNTHRIHYDLPYTKEVEGYPALVVHGPLLATLLMQLAAEHGVLKRFTYKAVSAAFCEQPMYLTARFEGKAGELAVIGCDGRVCVKAEALTT